MPNQSQEEMFLLEYILLDTQTKVGEYSFPILVDFDVGEQSQLLLGLGYEFLQSDVPLDTNLRKPGQIYHLYVREKISFVHADSPKKAGSVVEFHPKLCYPEGLHDTDLNKVLIREVRFTYEDGTVAFPSLREELHFMRAAMVNHAQQSISYLPWQAREGTAFFVSVTLPVIEGYYPEHRTLEPENVGDVDQTPLHQRKTIRYLKKTQQARVLVIDITVNKVLSDEVYKGKTGDAIEYPIEERVEQFIAQGYEIVENEMEGHQFYSANEGVVDTFTIQVRPRELEVTASDDLPPAGTPVYKELKQSVVWPSGIEKKDLEKQIIRTIYTTFEDGRTVIPPIQQTVTFERSAVTNLVTGTVLHTQWIVKGDNVGFDAYAPSEIDGFIAKPRHISAVSDVSIDTLSSEVTIVYTKKLQKVVVKFVDVSDQNRVIYQENLVGKTDERIDYQHGEKLNELLSNGYELVSSDFPEKAYFGKHSEKSITYNIQLTPRLMVVEPEHPKAVGSFIHQENYPNLRWPEGVEETSLRRDVIRTISYLYEDGSEVFPKTEEKIRFKRTATVNLVTYEVTYTEWHQTKSSFSYRNIPEVPGYTTDRDCIEEITDVTVDSSDYNLTVCYSKIILPDTLILYDRTANEILTKIKTYSREKSDIWKEVVAKSHSYIEQGYELASKSDEIQVILNKDETQTFIVQLRQVQLTITSQTPRKAHGMVLEHKRVRWPFGLEREDLTKKVSRTIEFMFDNGECAGQSIKQEVTFERTARINLVTGDLSYSEWKSSLVKMESVAVPIIEGYTSNVQEIASEVVNPEQLNQLVEIVYYPNPNSVTISFIDVTTKEVIYTNRVSGNVQEKLHYNPYISLMLPELHGYVIYDNGCPDFIEFNGESKKYTVLVEPMILEVHFGESHVPNTVTEIENYGSFTWPKGVDKHDLQHPVTRIIHYQNEKNEVLSESIVQSILFQRGAFINLVTLEISYTEWNSETNAFPERVTPKIQGYEANIASIPSLEVGPLLWNQNAEIVVRYSRTLHEVEIIVLDVESLTALETFLILADSNDEDSYTLDSLVSHYQDQGYELVEVKVSEDMQHIQILIKPVHVSVTLDLMESDFDTLPPKIAKQLKTNPELTRNNLSRTIKRLIHYRYTDNSEASPSFCDRIYFTRKADVNIATNKVQFGAWYSQYPVFDEVLSPIIEGFTASNEVSSHVENVIEDSYNIEEVVYYHRNVQQIVLNYINKATGDILHVEPLSMNDEPFSWIEAPANLSSTMSKTTNAEEIVQNNEDCQKDLGSPLTKEHHENVIPNSTIRRFFDFLFKKIKK